MQTHTQPYNAPFRFPCARHESTCGRSGIAPHVLNLGTRRRWVVRFTIWPLYRRKAQSLRFLTLSVVDIFDINKMQLFIYIYICTPSDTVI
jgi:hypothetical protein